jgi:hypothetical protein
MTREIQPPTVASATAVLLDLQAKHKKQMEVAEQLVEQRRSLAFKTHAVGDPSAERKLESVIAAIVTNTAVLASLADAVAEAELKVTLARACEQEAADRTKAEQILELTAALKEAGQEMDDACNTLSETGKLLVGIVSQLRAAGINFPSHDQLDVLGGQCIATMLMNTPWGRRYQRIAPRTPAVWPFDDCVVGLGDLAPAGVIKDFARRCDN